MMTFWPGDLASAIGDVSSAVGVVLTIFLTTTALQVRREFQRLILLPAGVEKFTQCCITMTELRKPGAARADLAQVLGVVEGTLKSLTRYLDRNDRKAVSELISEIGRYHGRPTDDALDKLHRQMWSLSTELEETGRRNQWNR